MKTDKNYLPGFTANATSFMACRTAQSHAAFLLPRLRPGWRLLDCGCGPGSITLGLARLVSPGEVLGLDQESSQIAIVLSHELWQRRFDGATNILGQLVQLSDRKLTVIGVMPPRLRPLPSPQYAHLPEYDLNGRVDFWLPDRPDPARPKANGWNVVGRLRDKVTPGQAEAELTAIPWRH